jgi:hypothetical protein
MDTMISSLNGPTFLDGYNYYRNVTVNINTIFFACTEALADNI